MPGKNLSAEVDAYVAKAQPFAQVILKHFREVVHRGCPGVEEAMKWGQPFFVYRGAILCNMGAFKEHCRLGFWGREIAALVREYGAAKDGSGMAVLQKVTRVEELPPEKTLLEWVRKAAALVDRGEYTSPVAARAKEPKKERAEVEMPAEFAAALKKNKKAGAQFAAFSPSGRRDYIEWIAEAKREETREKRIATAVEWIAEGKKRNWKYE